jgi:hypothetical protein
MSSGNGRAAIEDEAAGRASGPGFRPLRPRTTTSDLQEQERKMRAAVLGVVASLLVTASVSELRAQILNSPPVGQEIASVNLRVGLLAPQTTFNDPSFGESSFDSGFALGMTAAAWPILDRKVGLRGSLIRSRTDGQNATSEFAPIAINDPTVYMYTLEGAVRLPMAAGFPYASVGYGGKHYTWTTSAHKVSRFAAWTAATGYELRPAALGPFGVVAELRGYQSNFRGFGIDDGSWEDGPYGGRVGGVKNVDLLFTTGFSLHF